jgi:hypothetical protein
MPSPFQSTFTGFSGLVNNGDNDLKNEVSRLRIELENIRDEIGRKGKSDCILPIPFYLSKIEREDMNFDVNHSGLNIILMNSKVTTMNLNGLNKPIKRRGKSLDMVKPDIKKKNNKKKKKDNKPKYCLSDAELEEAENATELNRTTDIIQEMSEEDTDFN